jgi:mannitol 2-dehydrogenase
MGASDRLTLDEARQESAPQGENWTKFFLHPNADFEAPLPPPIHEEVPTIEILMGAESPRRERRFLDLNARNLALIAETQAQVTRSAYTALPGYSRSVEDVDSFMCHIGVGGFHRSHQAFLMDQILCNPPPQQERWAIFGLALLSFDEKLYANLKSQDYLYTLMNRDGSGSTSRIIGSIFDMLFAPDDRQAVIERLAHPKTKIVSLTITEKGYCMDTTGHHLHLQHPMILNDLSHPESPTSTVDPIDGTCDPRVSLSL